MVEASIDQSAIVGGRGNQLDLHRDGSRHGTVEVQVTGDLGRPVRGSNGVIGWMRDHKAVSKKVSGITYVINCYVICSVAGVYITSTSVFVSLASVTVINQYTVRCDRGVRGASK